MVGSPIDVAALMTREITPEEWKRRRSKYKLMAIIDAPSGRRVGFVRAIDEADARAVVKDVSSRPKHGEPIRWARSGFRVVRLGRKKPRAKRG
jgi:hypothetical protein